MENRYDELASVLAEGQECLEDLRKVAKHLPAGDKELEECLLWLAQKGPELSFFKAVHAALIAGRTPDVSILRKPPYLLRNERWLAGLVTKLGGDVAGYLLWAAERSPWAVHIRATALVAATRYTYEAGSGITRDGLRALYRKLLPELRMHEDVPPAVQEHAGRAMCALAMALGEELPTDRLKVVLRGKPRRGSKQKLKQEILEQRAQKELADLTQLARLPADLLLPPTSADVTPDRPASKTRKRVGVKIGKNDRCPCGSGQKYKRCCMGKELIAEQQAEGVMADPMKDFSEGKESLLTRERIARAPVSGLRQIDFAAVSPELRADLAQRFVNGAALGALFRLLQEVGIDEELEAPLVTGLNRAARMGDSENLARLATLIGEEKLAGMPNCLHAKLALLAPTPEAQAEIIEREFRMHVDDPQELSNLAVNLLWWRMPSLGIVAARGALASGVDARYAAGLQMQLEKVRTAEGLEGVDPATPIIERILEHAEEELELARAVEELSTKANRAAIRARKQEESIRAQEEEVQRLTEALSEANRPAQHGGAGADDARVRKLQTQLETFKARLGNSQDERRTLRQELDASQVKLSALEEELRAAEAEAEAGEAMEERHLGAAIQGPQPVRIPLFPRKFLANLKRFPEGVRRETVRLVGEMAAGYEHAWAGTRKLETRPDYLRQKIGRNYRVFLKRSEETLEVIDLVDRKDFERRLDSL